MRAQHEQRARGRDRRGQGRRWPPTRRSSPRSSPRQEKQKAATIAKLEAGAEGLRGDARRRSSPTGRRRQSTAVRLGAARARSRSSDATAPTLTKQPDGSIVASGKDEQRRSTRSSPRPT